MITEKQLKRANLLIDQRDRIAHILRGFDSPHVETTIGLVDVNSASKHETRENNDATWLHRKLPDIEKRLKETARGMLEEEAGKIRAELANLIG